MKTLHRSLFFSLLLSLGLASPAGASPLPAVEVSVLTASGKTVYKGATDASGAWRTPELAPGHYTVQFNSKSAPPGGPFALVVGAGKDQIVANSVPGRKFTRGGVAMKVEVGPSAMSLTGNLSRAGTAAAAAAPATSAPKNGVTMEDGLKVKYENGKKYVWVEGLSALGGHWAPAKSKEAGNAEPSRQRATPTPRPKKGN